MNQNQWVIFRSIWFWWVVTTVFYLALSIYLSPDTPTPLGYIPGFIGLFVPYGFLSFPLFFLSPFPWLSLVIFIVLMGKVERKLNKQNFSLSKRIFLNLLILLLLTVMVDFVRGTAFQSWVIFFNGKFPRLEL